MQNNRYSKKLERTKEQFEKILEKLPHPRNTVRCFCYFRAEVEDKLIIQVSATHIIKLTDEKIFSHLLQEGKASFPQVLLHIVDAHPVNTSCLVDAIVLKNSKDDDTISIDSITLIKKYLTENPPVAPNYSLAHSIKRFLSWYNNQTRSQVVLVTLPRSFSTDEVNTAKQTLIASKSENSFANQVPRYDFPAISRAGSRENSHSLPDGPLRLAYLHHFSPEPSPYNNLLGFSINGALNVSALQKSILYLIKRHESLRTGFDLDHKKQIILAPDQVDWLLDFEQISVSNLTSYIQSACEEYVKTKFDLNAPPLIRSKVVQALTGTGTTFIWLCVIHQGVCDRHSQSIFLKEIAQCYRHFTSNKGRPILPKLSIQYADYSAWLQSAVLSSVKEQQLLYWQDTLKHLQPLQFPTDFPRPAKKTFNGGRFCFHIPNPVTRSLKQMSIQLKTPLFALLLASFHCFLYRYTGQEDICTGTVNQNRRKGRHVHSQLAPMIGCIENLAAIRSTIDINTTVKELILSIKNNIQNMHDHSDVSFSEVINAINPPYDASRNPLFDTFFILQENKHGHFHFDKIEASPIEHASKTTEYDLTLELRESVNSLSGSFDFNTDLFTLETVQRLAANYQTLLLNFTQLSQKASEISIISPEELQHIYSFNSPISYDQDFPIHEIFQRMAAQQPQKNALVFNQCKLTYRELDEASNRVANNLLAMGVKPREIVAICMERSLEAEITTLGILKTGCAVVFLEAALKEQSTIYKKIAAIEPCAVVTDNITTEFFFNDAEQSLFSNSKTRLISWEDLAQHGSTKSPSICINIDDLALVAMTSGSTGTPKGVLVSHRGWTNWVSYFRNHPEFRIKASSRVFEGAPYPFDASLWERLLAYGLGGTLYVNDSNHYRDAGALKTLFEQEKITVATFTPSFLATLDPNDFSTLECIFVIGEALTQDLIRAWKEAIPSLCFINGYGPTESTAGVTLYHCHSQEPVLIGRPIDNMSVHILDSCLQPVPIGVEGEIYIGGVGVARGYYNLPQQTKNAFFQDPFSSDPRAMLYRTGDLGKFMPDGNIDFRGRKDNQIKLHGVRIELEEIESLIRLHPNVNQAFVKMWDKKYLAAYVITKNNAELPSDEIKQFLSNQGLATIKIPTVFMTIENIPLTKNGKLDSNSLPKPSCQSEMTILTDAPQTETECQLLALWQDILPVGRISMLDDFRDLGGDSFTLIKLLNAVNKELFNNKGKLLGLVDFPEQCSIRNLAFIIDDRRKTKTVDLPISQSMDELCRGLYNSESNNSFTR